MLIGEHRIPQISVGVQMEKRGKLRHTITTVTHPVQLKCNFTIYGFGRYANLRQIFFKYLVIVFCLKVHF